MSESIDVLAVLRWQHHIIKRLHEVSGGVDHALDLEDAELAAAAVAELLMDLHRIRDRATAHPGDTDADRKRDLQHVVALANQALSRVRGAA